MIAELQLAAPKPAARRKRRRWSDESGDEFDLDRARDGDAPWLQSHQVLQAGPQHVTLVTACAAHGSTSHYDLLWRGAAAIVAADALEAAGFRVELWLGHYAHNTYMDREYVFHAVKLKDSREPLNLELLVNCTSSWFYRVGMFCAYHVRGLKVDSSLGWPCAVTPELCADLGRNPIVSEGVFSKAAAAQLCSQIVKATELVAY